MRLSGPKVALISIVFGGLCVSPAPGCQVTNDNDVGCLRSDCVSACEALGFLGGGCAGDECECSGGDPDAYKWEEADASLDSGAKTDSGSGLAR